MIGINEKVPSVSVKYIENNEVLETDFREYTSNKKVVIFGLPGAFTPACSNYHLPSFAESVDAFKAKGVDEFICLSVNDVFVLKAWAQHHKVEHEINFIADGSAELTKKMGLILDATPYGMGIRSQRYAIYIEFGVMRVLNVESSAGACTISAAPILIDQID